MPVAGRRGCRGVEDCGPMRLTSNVLEVQRTAAFPWWEGAGGFLGSSEGKLFKAARRGVKEAWGLASEEEVLAVREGGMVWGEESNRPMLAGFRAIGRCRSAG